MSNMVPANISILSQKHPLAKKWKMCAPEIVKTPIVNSAEDFCELLLKDSENYLLGAIQGCLFAIDPLEGSFEDYARIAAQLVFALESKAINNLHALMRWLNYLFGTTVDDEKTITLVAIVGAIIFPIGSDC